MAGNTLDLVCTDLSYRITNTSVIQPGLSDHYMIEINISTSQTAELQNNVDLPPIRLFKQVDLPNFEKSLAAIHKRVTKCIGFGGTIDNVWNIFKLGLHNAINDHVPTRQRQPKRPNEPLWFNKSAKRACNKQRKLYSLYKKKGDSELLNKYKQLRRSNKKLFKNLKKDYMTNRLYNPLVEGDTKPFYRYIKELKGNANKIVSMEQDNGVLTENDYETANILNSFFQSVFSKPSPLPTLPFIADPQNISISTNGVLKLIDNLKTGKAAGPDKIGKNQLTLDPEGTAAILTSIFNYSLQTGTLPEEWKIAHVTPIYKQGSRTSPSNYRPISLTCICCKLLEHIIVHQLNAQLTNKISSNQHGFRKSLSCCTQLITVNHDILKFNDSGSIVHAAILDFSKAFDVVNHSKLLTKLIGFGINPILIRWIASFLQGRSQRVLVGGRMSDPVQVTSGVPQGSVLGPTLFILFINDIVDCVTNSSIRLFADDTLVYHPITNSNDMTLLQTDLDNLFQWGQSNGMLFNAKKSTIVSFGKTSLTDKYLINYHLGNTPLITCDTVKYLGVYLSKDNKWNTHIEYICMKASRILGLLKNTISDAPVAVKLIAYKQLCRPVLEYAAEVWDPHTATHSDMLERIQNKAVRFIKNIKGREVSVSEGKFMCGLKSLKHRRQQQRLSLYINIVSNKDTFPSIHDTLTEMNASTHYMTTRSNNLNALSCDSGQFLQGFILRTSREIRTGEIVAD